MNFIDGLNNRFSKLSRSLPRTKGYKKLYKKVNWTLLKLGANPIVMAQMNDGTEIKVDLTTRTERLSYYTGFYDENLLSMIKELLNGDRVFLDVGANIGFYTIAISKLMNDNGSGKTLAFEPFNGNFERLKFNVDHNDLNQSCLIHNYGLSDKKGANTITLREDFKHGSKTGNASISISDSMDAKFETSSIKLEKLDDIWQENFGNLGIIDFVKVDIEGHEDFFLRGAQQTINEHRPTILMEVNKPYYISRGVELDATFLPLIPKNYLIYKSGKNGWSTTKTLTNCDKVDNVFLIPIEKLSTSYYQKYFK